MKKVFTILSVLLIVTGLKAQKANVQKETVKPQADTLVKNGAAKQLDKTTVQQKVWKEAPAVKKAPATIKKSAPAPATFKKTATQQ